MPLATRRNIITNKDKLYKIRKHTLELLKYVRVFPTIYLWLRKQIPQSIGLLWARRK